MNLILKKCIYISTLEKYYVNLVEEICICCIFVYIHKMQYLNFYRKNYFIEKNIFMCEDNFK